MKSTRTLVLAALVAVLVAFLGGGVARAVTGSAASAALAKSPNQPSVASSHAVTPAALAAGSSASDTFTPITPCRIADTRVAGGMIAHTATRNFQVTGTTGFTGQGGTATGCGIPSYAKAVSLSATAVNETAGGNVIIYPAGATKPLTAVSSFTKNVVMTGFTTAALGTNGQVTAALAGAGNINLVLDVSGYFAAPIAGTINISGGVFSGTGRIIATSHPSAGEYTLTTDSVVTGCTAYSTLYENQYYTNAHVSGTNTIVVEVWTLSGGNPVLTDRAFDYHVICG